MRQRFQFLVGLTILLVNPQLLASKARLHALQGAELAHLVDTQTVFSNPAHIHMLPNYVTFEMGQVGLNAEGGFLQTTDSGMKIGVYVGRQNVMRSFVEPALRQVEGFDSQVNPFEIFWGDSNQAFSIAVSRFNDKANGLSETSLLGKYGLLGTHYEVWGHWQVMSELSKRFGSDHRTLKSAPEFLVGARFMPEESFWHFFTQSYYTNSTYKSVSRSSKSWDSQFSIGVEHRELRSPGFDWFYGVRFDYTKRDSDYNDLDISGYQLPAFLGAEINLSPYLTVRGSVLQNALMGEQKRGLNASTAISSNTQTSVGLGLKYNHAILDGVLVASNSGDLGTDKLLAQCALTYEF